MTQAIAIGALIAALAPLYAMYLTMRRDANRSYESTLERRTAKLEEQLKHANERVQELEDENLRLMRKLVEE